MKEQKRDPETGSTSESMDPWNKARFRSGFEITTEIVHDSHDFHDEIFVDFSAE